jgi:uncharacterized protein YcbX
VHVAELWRYPVHSLGGELLSEANLTTRGLEGDRLVHVVDREGYVLAAPRHPYLRALEGGVDADGVPTVAGLAWDDPRALLLVRAASRRDARLVYDDGGAPVRITFGRRRPRTNIYLAGMDSRAERRWSSCVIRLGAALVGLQRRAGAGAVDCYVIEPGAVRIGDAAELLDAWTLLRPEAAAG